MAEFNVEFLIILVQGRPVYITSVINNNLFVVHYNNARLECSYKTKPVQKYTKLGNRA